MLAASGLLKLYLDGGVVMHALLLYFLVAVGIQVAQLALARRFCFPGMSLGSATVLLSLGTVGVAIGYRLSLDVIAEQGLRPSLVLRATEITLTPALFALGFVAILGAFQVGVDALTRSDAGHSYVRTRAARIVGTLGVLVLVIAATLLVRTTMFLTGSAATQAVGSAEVFMRIQRGVDVALTAGIAGLGLGAATMVLSVVSAVRGSRGA